MRYIPHSPQDTEQMLRELKLTSVDDLFRTVPKSACFDTIPQVTTALEEREIAAYLGSLAARNSVAAAGSGWQSYLGAGTYNHYIPSAVDSLSGRGEYLTSYTPYQAEICQGNLQVSFEFQSLVANLLAMDVANASVYDGAHALVEAVFMARRMHKGHKVLVSAAIHPQYLTVLKTYAQGLFEVVEVPCDPKSGATDLSKCGAMDDVFGVALQHPNFFGCLEDVKALKNFGDKHGVVTILGNTEPLAFAALQPPGHYGIDIFAGEAQSFGNASNYGGPLLGVLATMKQNLRNIPGRLIGKTFDADGKPGYVMTLTTREQHIRREKATSNICTNQFLLALRATIYMALLGEAGLRKLAFENAQRMTHLLKLLDEAAPLKRRFASAVFNECVIDLGCDAEKVARELEKQKIIAGLPLRQSGMEQCLLVNVTELQSNNDITTFVKALQNAARSLK